MTKNKLEKLFGKTLKNVDYWGIKLHNNPLAHQATPADYILYRYNRLVMLECKLVTCKEGKGRFAFNRLTQLHDLLAFENHCPKFDSYLCLAFYDKRWANSEIYIIPISAFDDFMYNINTKSVNRKVAKESFFGYSVKVVKGVIQWQ